MKAGLGPYPPSLHFCLLAYKTALAMENRLRTGDFHLEVMLERHLKVGMTLISDTDQE